MANKVFTVLSCAELAAALYIIFNKDGELAHYREWKQLAAELASEIKKYSLNANATFADVHKYRIFVSDVLKVDMTAADANIKLAAARISFVSTVLEVDMDAKDTDAQFAKALAEFESLARFNRYRTQSQCIYISLSQSRYARKIFGEKVLGVDMTAVDAEKQFAAALAEYDALEKEGIASDTLESRRTIKGFNDVVRAQVAILLVDGALPATTTRAELETMLDNYETLQSLEPKSVDRFMALGDEEVQSLLGLLSKLNQKTKDTLPKDLEASLKAVPTARQALIEQLGAGLTDLSTPEEVMARLKKIRALPASWHDRSDFRQVHAQVAEKMWQLVQQEGANLYRDMPAEIRELIQGLRFFDLSTVCQRKKNLEMLHATHGTSPAYAQAMQLVDGEIAKLQDAAEQQKQDIARQENLKIGELVTFTDRQTCAEYHAQVVGINPNGSRVFETDPKKFIAPALLPQNQDRLKAELHRLREATRGRLGSLLGRALPQPAGVIKLEVLYKGCDPETQGDVLLIQDVLFIEEETLPDANSDDYEEDENIWHKGQAYYKDENEDGTFKWAPHEAGTKLVEVPAKAI